MASLHQSKWSDKKQCTVEVRWSIFFMAEIYCFFIPKSGCKYFHSNSYIIYAPLSSFYRPSLRGNLQEISPNYGNNYQVTNFL